MIFRTGPVTFNGMRLDQPAEFVVANVGDAPPIRSYTHTVDVSDLADQADLARRRSAQNAVGKTIKEINEWGWRSEIIFTDDTKLQIEPGECFEDEQGPAVLIFQEDRAAD